MGFAPHTTKKTISRQLLASTPVPKPVTHEKLELDDGHELLHAEISIEEYIDQGFRVSGRVGGCVYWYSSFARRIWCVELSDGDIVYVRLDDVGGRPHSKSGWVLHVVDGTGSKLVWPGKSTMTVRHPDFWRVLHHLSDGALTDTGLARLV